MSDVIQGRRELIAASEGSTEVGFGGSHNFALTMRVAELLSKSEFVPTSYQGEKGMPNCVIALELANRLGVSWMAVMQNLYVVYGRPAWMASFVIASVNGCGRFHSLRFDFKGQGDDRQCQAWTLEKSFEIPKNVRTIDDAMKANLPVLEGTPITWRMVKAEGWLDKKGSKWATMPEQMFRYRAASFWARVYAPELLMGIVTADEAEDAGTPRAVPEVPSPGAIVDLRPQPKEVNGKASGGNGERTPAEQMLVHIEYLVRATSADAAAWSKHYKVPTLASLTPAQMKEFVGILEAAKDAGKTPEPPAAPKQEPGAPPDELTDAQYEKIVSLVRERKLSTIEVSAMAKECGAKSLKSMTRAQAEAMLRKLAPAREAGVEPEEQAAETGGW